MAKTFTLEEAAQKLGLTPDQFKTHLKTHKDFKSIRPLMGGATMHFRAQDIEELGRRLGLGSDPELKLGDSSSDPSLPAAGEDEAQVEIGREIVRGTGHSSARLKPPSSKRIKAAPPPEEHPLLLETSGDFIPLAPDEPAKKPDSDVKLAKGSDSDVRLEKGSYQPQGTPTEEIDLEKEEKVRRKEGKTEDTYEMQDEKATIKHQTSPKKPGSSSKLLNKPSSSSEFEMTLADDSGEEVDLGSLPVDVAGKEGKSGVNLKKPDDSGISLEKPDSDSEFELNLDSSSSVKISGPKSGKKLKDDSESEFELTLDDSSGEVGKLGAEEQSGQKDIFETDFDIPALDDESGSEAVVLEETDTDLESSDFDLALDESSVAEAEGESASEVVQLDDDGAAEVEDASAEEALADVEEEAAPVAAGSLPPAKWGPLPALVMIPCVIVLFIVGLMAMELMHGQWGYRQSYRPTSSITRGIASMFYSDNELPKE
jgi:hypothetical protein